jgi:hypothetical protein
MAVPKRFENCLSGRGGSKSSCNGHRWMSCLAQIEKEKKKMHTAKLNRRSTAAPHARQNTQRRWSACEVGAITDWSGAPGWPVGAVNHA